MAFFVVVAKCQFYMKPKLKTRLATTNPRDEYLFAEPIDMHVISTTIIIIITLNNTGVWKYRREVIKEIDVLLLLLTEERRQCAT